MDEEFLPVPEDAIWVFGSNLGGFHGAGCAYTALKKYGARWGCGIGRYGKSYAIPTKDERLQVLPLHAIERNVQTFRFYVLSHPQETFYLTEIGTGLAGIPHATMVAMFAGLPDNVIMPKRWAALLAEMAIPEATNEYD